MMNLKIVRLMMKTNTELFAIAKSQLGNGGAKYRKYVGIGKGQPYCDAFVFWLYDANGCGDLLKWKGSERTYCPSSIKWCNKNLALIPPYLAMPCDIVYFDWEKNGTPNHVGIVYNKISTSTIHTLEGNTSGGIVDDKKRSVKYVQGIYRPHFRGVYKIGLLTVDGVCSYSTIAMMQKVLNVGFVDGILGKATVKGLQKKAGCTADGAWGKNTSKAVQKMVGTNVDGEFGPKSVEALQKWINRQYAQMTKVPQAKPTPQTEKSPVSASQTVKGYTGQFPDLIAHSGQIIGYTAISLAWPKGTAKAKYTYGKGHATEAFQKAINKVYPNRKSWSKQCQEGASCDVGAGTVIRYSGIDPKIPRGLEEQIPYLEKSNRFKKTNLTKTSQMLAGDVGVYIGKTKGAHIWIGIGNKQIAEANHTAKYFEHIDTDDYTSSNKKVWGIYRACVPSAIVLGNRGTEVVKLQKFLNWYNKYGLATDGICGAKTVAAVKDFQKRQGITADGAFGSASLAKAKKCLPCVSVAKVTQKVADISYWQHNIDWAKASKDIDGVIARASYTAQASFTLSDDSTFSANVNGAYNHGLKVGAYHYSQAVSADEAKKEATYLCKKINAYKGKISLPVCIDWEFGGRLSASKAKALGKAKCTEIIEAFCEIVTGYGYTPMVYANYNTFANYLDYPRLKKKYMIWLAQYSSKASLEYDYWQYTSSGSVSGINGKVDLNKAVK